MTDFKDFQQHSERKKTYVKSGTARNNEAFLKTQDKDILNITKKIQQNQPMNLQQILSDKSGQEFGFFKSQSGPRRTGYAKANSPNVNSKFKPTKSQSPVKMSAHAEARSKSSVGMASRKVPLPSAE